MSNMEHLRLESEQERDTRQLLLDAKAAIRLLTDKVIVHTETVDCPDECGEQVATFHYAGFAPLNDEEVEAVVAAANAVPELLTYIDRLHQDLRRLRAVHAELHGMDTEWSTDYERNTWGK